MRVWCRAACVRLGCTHTTTKYMRVPTSCITQTVRPSDVPTLVGAAGYAATPSGTRPVHRLHTHAAPSTLVTEGVELMAPYCTNHQPMPVAVAFTHQFTGSFPLRHQCHALPGAALTLRSAHHFKVLSWKGGSTPSRWCPGPCLSPTAGRGGWAPTAWGRWICHRYGRRQRSWQRGIPPRQGPPPAAGPAR